jgi:hypothetical protein
MHNNEVNSNFRYNATSLIRPWNLQMRKLSEISKAARKRLASGTVETADWTEWMATDMPTLARTVAAKTPNRSLRKALLTAATNAEGLGILDRLAIFGGAVACTFKDFEDLPFLEIATHQSDVVRQWGAYAVNEPTREMSLTSRLELTRRFAADPHMSVRECAWMAFRPHFAARLGPGLRLLERVSRSENPNERRFSVEVSRPRSVWGRHIPALKQKPEMASALLSNVCKDDSRYVRLNHYSSGDGNGFWHQPSKRQKASLSSTATCVSSLIRAGLWKHKARRWGASENVATPLHSLLAHLWTNKPVQRKRLFRTGLFGRKPSCW